MERTAEEWIAELGLEPHPEGGYFRETFRAPVEIPEQRLGTGAPGARPCATSIDFLLRPVDVSRLHRLRFDELWCLLAGGPLTLHLLHEDGSHETRRLGRQRGALPRTTVAGGTWFGATVDGNAPYALVACTVVPGFDFRDFTLGSRQELLERFPDHRHLVEALTPE